MSKHSMPFSLIKRGKSPFWSFKLEGWKNYKSAQSYYEKNIMHFDSKINCKLKTDAMKVVEIAMKLESGVSKAARFKTFRDYSAPYYIFEKCPRTQRLINEGKSMGDRWLNSCRSWLETYVYPDKFCDLSMSEIKRGHILELRERLKKRVAHLENGMNTVNKAIQVVKSIIKDAYYRNDIDRNSGAGIGLIKYSPIKKGIFDIAELRELFKDCPGYFKDETAYAAFHLAAYTGMRTSEVKALNWDSVDFENKTIYIHRAWKTSIKIGLPKNNTPRKIPVINEIIENLKRIKKKKDIIFLTEREERLSERYWAESFRHALKNMGLNPEERKLTPHSLRHTINTHLIGHGCNPVLVQQYLGWINKDKSLVTAVQYIYTQINSDHLQEVIRNIREILL